MGRKALAIGWTSALAILALALAAGCGGGGAEGSGQVRGQVVEVVGRNITEIETLRVRDEDGKLWTFTTEGFAGFTPAHLREHQLLGQSVLVSYEERGDRLVAVNIED